jgi:hypothetical protein
LFQKTIEHDIVQILVDFINLLISCKVRYALARRLTGHDIHFQRMILALERFASRTLKIDLDLSRAKCAAVEACARETSVLDLPLRELV